MVFNDDVFRSIEERFKKRGLKISEKNREQAMIPVKCISLENSMGTAAGMLFESNTGNSNSIFISMPGVPYEMKEMMKKAVLPLIKNKFHLSPIIHKYIMTSGIGESWIADKIEDIENKLPSHIGLAYLPSPGIVKLRLTTRVADIKNDNFIIKM